MKPLTLLILSLLTTLSLSATGIHVGSGQKYKTIYAATSTHSVHAGDTVYIHAGIYTDAGQVFDSLIGTPSKWITIRPYQNDSVSIHVQYTFQHAQYLKVTGLNFYGNDTAQWGKYYHQLFFDYEYACYTANHNIIVDNCRFTDLNVPVSQGASAACLKLTGTDSFQVINCLFKNCTNVADGVSMNADRNGLVQNCRFENISGNGSHCKGGAKKIYYTRNLFINCIASAINIGGATGPTFFCPAKAQFEADSIFVYSNITIGGLTGFDLISTNHSEVVNNTCFKSTQFAFRVLNEDTLYPFGNNYVYNNIFAPYSINHIYMNAGGLKDYSTFYFKNNLYHDYKNADPKTIWWGEMTGSIDSNELIADPMFSDTAKWDFSLQKGSPAIGGGCSIKNSFEQIDFSGKTYSSPRSIGAIEYAGVTALQDYEDANNITIYPNPSKGVFNIVYSGAGSISRIEVYSMLGQKVYAESTLGYLPKINLSGMNKGMYKVIIYTNRGRVNTGSVVVE